MTVTTPINYIIKRLDYVHGHPPPTKCERGQFLREKWSKNEAHLATQFNADVKNLRSSLPLPNVPSWRTSLYNFIMERIVR